MYNRQYNANSETELVNMPPDTELIHVKSKPFDWFICSVLGYLCFPCTGICAIYYAVRANHAVDWGRDESLILRHSKKAKYLTLISIIVGLLLIIISIIIITVLVMKMTSAIEQISSTMNQMSTLNQAQGENQEHPPYY